MNSMSSGRWPVIKPISNDLIKIANDLAAEESKLSILAAVVFEDGTPDRLRDEFDSKLQKWAKDCTQVSLTEMDDGSKQEIYESALRWLQTSKDHGFPEHQALVETLLNNVACCFMRQRSWGRALTVLSCAFQTEGLAFEQHAKDITHDPVMLLNLSECLYEVNEQDEADNVLLAVLATLESKTPGFRDFDFLIALSTAYYNFSKRILLRSDIRDHDLAFQCLSAAQALSEVCNGMTIDPARASVEKVLNPSGQDIRIIKERVYAKLKERDRKDKTKPSRSTFEFGLGTNVPGLSGTRITSLIDIPKRTPVKFKPLQTLANVNLEIALTEFRTKNQDRDWLMQTSLDAWHSRLKSQIEAVTVHPSQFLKSPSAPFA